MASFNMAYEMGADMIELDVLLSKDGIPVVIHDVELKRLAGIPELVSDLTFNELSHIDVGSWFRPEFKGEKISSLDEVLSWARNKIALNIEIKTEAVSDRISGGVEEKVIELVRKHGMNKNVLLSSFDSRAVERFKKIDNGISSGYLFSKETLARQSPVELMHHYKSDFFHVDKWKLTQTFTQELTDAGYPILVYTVNSKVEMKMLIRRGVSGIFSDRPDRLRDVAGQLIKDRIR